MATTEDKNLKLAEAELKFIARHIQTIEGNFDAVDEIAMAVASARCAIEEYRLSLQPEVDEFSDETAIPEAA